VIGPALDGGHPLPGLKESNSDLFRDVSGRTLRVVKDPLTRIAVSEIPILEGVARIGSRERSRHLLDG